MRLFLALLVALVLAGCNDGPLDPPPDQNTEDPNEAPNGDPDPDDPDPDDPDPDDPDPDDPDPDPDDPDPDPDDPEVPLPGFGTITGPCGFIDDELYDPSPDFVVNGIDFADDPYDHPEDFDFLTPDGQTLYLADNAGGSSLLSEVFALEILARCEFAELIASETEIVYDVEGKITDMLVAINDEYVGVSVVRAVGWPRDAPYTVEDATTILERKLSDILESSDNVSDEHRWVKQILHVIAYDDEHATSMEIAWGEISEDILADTLVIVTVTYGDDAFLY